MKATTHQVDKLTEAMLMISEDARKRGQERPTYSDLQYDWEQQTRHSLADYRKMDAMDFAYHLGYFTRNWGMKLWPPTTPLDIPKRNGKQNWRP